MFLVVVVNSTADPVFTSLPGVLMVTEKKAGSVICTV
jgi:hypothetical protein